MTKEEEKYLFDLKIKVNRLMDEKFRRGSAKYPDETLQGLSVEKLLRHAIDEGIDEVIYNMTALENYLKERDTYLKTKL